MDDLSKSLEKTLEESSLKNIDDELVDIATETAETALDDVTNAALEELPVIKTILVVPKVYKGISSYLLIKKILRFLTQLSTISTEERQRFLQQLEEDKRSEILENLMLILEKHDSYKKSEIQGKVFAAYIKGEINGDEYSTLTYATSMLDVNGLSLLQNYYINVREGHSPEMTAGRLYNFVFLQLIDVDNSQIGLIGGGGPIFQKNELGKKYITLLE